MSGANVILDNLLGPILVPDPDLARRCDIILPESDTTTFGFGPVLADELPRERCEWCESVGVGGVLTMTGAPGSEGGGVRGRPEVSIGAGLFRRRGRSAGAILIPFVSDWEEVLGRETEPAVVDLWDDAFANSGSTVIISVWLPLLLKP